MRIKEIKIGTDPEVFLYDNLSERFEPSELFISGSKKNPLILSELGEGFKVLCDNVMVEFNVPPASSPHKFMSNLSIVQQWMKMDFPENISIKAVPSAEFDMQRLNSFPGSLEFGCEPDYNVYSERENTPPELGSTNMRFAGGHIHIGYKNPNKETSKNIIKAMDLFLGVSAVILDSDKIRSKYYGTAGRMRLTKYGAEYRTLSNFWLATKELQNWAFMQTILACDFINNNLSISKDDEELIIECINNSNEGLARVLIDKYSLVLPDTKDVEELPNFSKYTQLMAEL
jgi:hypothetical protein